MRRTLQLLVLSIVLGAWAASAALAASSPTVATGSATKRADSTAVLNASINPNGAATTWEFQYGPTTAYGATTTSRTTGHGTKAISVSREISGLLPGTVYHYRIVATNSHGQSVGQDRAFTTTGHPPATVVTGGPVNIGKTSATATGVINPQGEATTWEFQYGLSTSYGAQTSPPGTLPASNAPVAVSSQIAGLAPGTLFHYRLVALHGTNVVTAGGDETFFTEPATRPRPHFTAHTSPPRDRRSPYQFTTKGTLSGATSIPNPYRCAGNVGVRYFSGRRQVAFVVAPIGSDCKFSVAASFRRTHHRGPVKLKITVDYRGTGYVAPVNVVDHVSAG